MEHAPFALKNPLAVTVSMDNLLRQCVSCILREQATNEGRANDCILDPQQAARSAAVLAAALAATLDLERYTKPWAIFAALEAGHVRLISAMWLIDQWKAGAVLARRQELPEKAFVTVEEIKIMYGEGNWDSVLPIISVSFCWLTPAHPDPEGTQLATVAATLEREMPKYAKADEDGGFNGFPEMGIFWDWLSLHQKDPALFDPRETSEAKPDAERAAFITGLKAKTTFYGGAAYEHSRTAEERAHFDAALSDTMDLWYAHQGTPVYMLTELPKGSTRKAGYNDSGWTMYERSSAEQIKKFDLFRAKWKLVLDLGANAAASRRWPVSPDEFDTFVETKRFTNGADTGVVKALYRRTSMNLLGSVETLGFEMMAAPTVEDAVRLGGCLNLCVNLKILNLTYVGMDDAVCAAAFSMLAAGALLKLETLYLVNNKIGDAGVVALARAASAGAFRKLERLDLQDNQIANAGIVALANTCSEGGLPSIKQIFMEGNKTTNVGEKAMGQVASARGFVASM